MRWASTTRASGGSRRSSAWRTATGLTIMLSQARDASMIRPNAKARGDESWDAYVWVKDADALYAEVKPRGAIIAYEPALQEEYGNREFGVLDLDGYLLAFGSEAP